MSDGVVVRWLEGFSSQWKGCWKKSGEGVVGKKVANKYPQGRLRVVEMKRIETRRMATKGRKAADWRDGCGKKDRKATPRKKRRGSGRSNQEADEPLSYR